MKIIFEEQAWEDYEYWNKTDVKTLKKIIKLISAITKDPFNDIGKPELLKYNLKGFWSRRITDEHRLVYVIQGKKGDDQICVIIQCRFHYEQ